MCVMMITHRLAAVRTTDLIVVLEEGRIMEMGNWMELTAARGTLLRLAAAAH